MITEQKSLQEGGEMIERLSAWVEIADLPDHIRTDLKYMINGFDQEYKMVAGIVGNPKIIGLQNGDDKVMLHDRIRAMIASDDPEIQFRGRMHQGVANALDHCGSTNDPAAEIHGILAGCANGIVTAIGGVPSILQGYFLWFFLHVFRRSLLLHPRTKKYSPALHDLMGHAMDDENRPEGSKWLAIVAKHRLEDISSVLPKLKGQPNVH